MGLAQLSVGGEPTSAALVREDRILDLSGWPELDHPHSSADLLARWDDVQATLDALADDEAAGWKPLAGFQVHRPVDPRQVFQCGATYRTHVIDLAVAHHDGRDGRTVEQVRADAAAQMDDRRRHAPYVFVGLPSAISGPFDDVILPADG
ncbi:hypothetical protein SAMN05443668_103551 [Cryptosporangium aurantiacum]|uniref:Uncharacterized protein n=1 Tax=Cryptosporangium aurantiacum TaxID=134849 RepID=A0A1M7PP95_9ACTN|nr:hypothetical protein [Cryptosporangium aurantiacum]SHN19161.1 hypothetical protein SAMN05443668_103551 [Cryptosporangium aurantiacum]